MDACEVNFDGIVGPTHNYSGLSYGNVASLENKYQLSNPREAALQGLDKMKFLADKGIRQAVLPPQERPHIPTLRALGFEGTDKEIIAAAFKHSPELFLAVSSAACMWTANAATVSPSADSADRRVHFTPANLSSKFHRSIESVTTSKVLQFIFQDPLHFVHHPPLPSTLADEGAANHTRFCKTYGDPGIQLFVYGRHALHQEQELPKTFPPRQTEEASRAIARLHRLDDRHVIFSRQHPDAIDAGAFHNDVVSVGNQNVFLYHEQAFANKNEVISKISQKMEMVFLEVKSQDISLADAISGYLFNSQLISLPEEEMILIAPAECQENEKIRSYLEGLVQSPGNPIRGLHFLNLHQSMRNGGGPACLRLRVVLTPEELAAMHPGILLDDKLYQKLKKWIIKHYRDRLDPKDLADPQLFDEGRQALDELTHILQLGPLSHFQTS